MVMVEQGAPEPTAPLRCSDEPDDATAFLAEHAATLGDGLRRSDDPMAVAAALAFHDASHENWGHLIASAEQAGASELALELSDLYEFYGRLAESLENGVEGWLSPQAAYAVRAVLADRVATRTAAAIEALLRLPPGATSLS
jgi:hypothetical protein